jgi:hypothetical protein
VDVAGRPLVPHGGVFCALSETTPDCPRSDRTLTAIRLICWRSSSVNVRGRPPPVTRIQGIEAVPVEVVDHVTHRVRVRERDLGDPPGRHPLRRQQHDLRSPQVTTEPLSRRTIRSSRLPSSLLISRSSTRVAIVPSLPITGRKHAFDTKAEDPSTKPANVAGQSTSPKPATHSVTARLVTLAENESAEAEAGYITAFLGITLESCPRFRTSG